MSAVLAAVAKNPLDALFRESYQEFVETWNKWRSPVAVDTELTDQLANSAASEMLNAMISITDQLGRRANLRLIRSDLGQADALQYAFVAIVDEILLNLPWKGRGPWRDNLLEEAVFQTRICGERLFDRMQAVMRVRNQQCLDLAEVYLNCLNLGFRGKYRDTSHGAEDLARLKADLYYFVYQSPPDLYQAAHLLIERADQNVLRTEPKQRSLADRFRWYLYVLGILAIPFFISCLLWGHVYLEISHIIEHNPLSAQ